MFECIRKQIKIACLVAVGLAWPFFQGANAQSQFDSYEAERKNPQGRRVWPTYNASKFERNELVSTQSISYVETLILDSQIDKVDPDYQYNYATPESAFISRMTAIKNLDYAGWLLSWDDESRKLAEAKFEKENMPRDYWLKVWKNRFVFGSIKLVRKIETRGYVIFTYRLYNQKGVQTGMFEMPSTFKEVEGQWKATLDLRADVLLISSPWVSGENSKTVQIDQFY